MADRDIFGADGKRPTGPDDPGRPQSAKLGPAGWVALVVLFGFLAVTGFYAIYGWGQLPGVGVSTAGWFFLIGGVLITVLLGAGLMALMFYSSRKGRDF